MTYATDGQLPRDANGALADGVYSPNVGTIAVQSGTVTVDKGGQPSAPALVQLGDGLTPTQTVNVKAANTSPTLADQAQVVALSPNVTGLPVVVPTIVQKAAQASTGSVASLAKAFTNNNIAGNSIVVVCGAGNNGTLTVTDTLGNTYTSAIVQANSTTFEAQIFYAVGILGGANTVTVTNGGATASIAMEIYEVSGLITQVTAQPDQATSGTGTSAAPALSALSASSPNSLAFLGVAVGTAAQAVSVTSGTSWSLDSTQNTTTPSGLYTFGSLSQFLSTTSPVVPKATIASSEPYAAVAAIFKPVVLGVQGTVTLAGYNYTNITTQTTTLVKSGAGILHSIIINSHAASATIEMDDALTHTTPKIGTITLPSTVSGAIPITLEYDIVFNTGLSITTGTANADVTVVWK